MLGVEKIDMRQKEVFDKYFRTYYQSLCYFAYNYLKEQEGAEDVVQDMFIKLLDTAGNFDSEEHLKYYLYKSVRNACLNQIRLTSIRAEILENVQKNSPEEENDFFVSVVRTEVYGEIMKAVQGLPSECGRVFKLSYIDGYSNEEVADQLAISVNTVKSQKNKAKAQLRERLKGLYPVLLLFLEI